MAFWGIITGAALMAAVILGRVLVAGRDTPPEAVASDMQVYRDQLAEVGRDQARGLLDEAEAEQLRAEVSRRLLAADRRLQDGVSSRGGQPPAAGRMAAGLAALVLLAGPVMLYHHLGAPGAQDVPLTARIAASDVARANRLSQAEAEARLPAAMADEATPQVDPAFLSLMEKLRQTVAARPNDLQGLTLLMRNEARLGNWGAARMAQAQIIAVKGPEARAQDHTTLADLMIRAAGGYVSQEAELALRAALQNRPSDPWAHYYLGLYLLQVDRPDGAFRLWSQLLQESRAEADAPWALLIRPQMEELAWRAGVKDYTPPPPPSAPALPGPDAADIEAASQVSAADREAMIRGMVAQLSDRLARQGGSAAEWARLIGAYGVLGDTKQATAIWAEAQTVFAGDGAALAHIRAAALEAGVAE